MPQEKKMRKVPKFTQIAVNPASDGTLFALDERGVVWMMKDAIHSSSGTRGTLGMKFWYRLDDQTTDEIE